MSVVAPPTHGKAWLLQITALCVILGVLLALSLKTQRDAAKEGVPIHMPDVRAALRITKQDNIKLQKELAEVKLKYEDIAKEQAQGLSSAKSLEQALTETKLLAGTVSAKGPGVTVTIHDSPKLVPSEENKEYYMVHDADLRNVANELFSAGAEVVSINGQRLIANSSIRCAGPVILVNSVEVAAPYVIKAIGKPDVLENALRMPGGLADDLFLLDMIEIKKYNELVIVGYTGSSSFNYATPASTE